MSGITELQGDINGKGSCTYNMRLFGLPYQFINSVDPRYPSISSTIGRSYIDHIIMQAPTAFIIPGKPVFLPGVNGERKEGVTKALIEGMNGNFSALQNVLSDNPEDKLRFYDFEEDYSEYMRYVNIMCRTAATFLELPQTINVGGKEVSLQQYDWKNYRWDRDYYTGAAGSQFRYIANTTLSSIGSLGKKVINSFTKKAVSGGEDGENQFKFDTGNGNPNSWTTNFIQLYIDPSSGSSTNFANSTAASGIKSSIDTASQMMKELQFVTGTAGIGMQGAQNFMDGSVAALEELTSGAGAIGDVLSKILSVGSHVLKGENVVLPEIYQGSEFGTDYTIVVHLRSPYGNKLAVYMDVIVPLLHILALVAPRQTTSNTYGSPFLVKVYYPGAFNCNLGIVESVQVTRPSNEDAWNTDRLPTEIEVQIRIKDLYSDFSISPSTDTSLFANNSSLIDYLATISGLSLIEPQMQAKINTSVNNFVSSITDIPANIGAEINDFFERKFRSIVTL